jgi:hypothetical protein
MYTAYGIVTLKTSEWSNRSRDWIDMAVDLCQHEAV